MLLRSRLLGAQEDTVSLPRLDLCLAGFVVLGHHVHVVLAVCVISSTRQSRPESFRAVGPRFAPGGNCSPKPAPGFGARHSIGVGGRRSEMRLVQLPPGPGHPETRALSRTPPSSRPITIARVGQNALLHRRRRDWANGRLKVTGKGREHTLPIPIDVGQALEAWLRLRPVALDRAVFVRIRAPRRMFTVSGISGVIARLSDLAGIDRIYAPRLRHTAGMDVLAAGGTWTEAKELLGHVYTVTTMAYAKVDLASPIELVVPFGQVPR